MVCVCKIRPYLLRRKVLLAAFQHFDNIYLIPSFLSGIFIWHLFGQSIWHSVTFSLCLAEARQCPLRCGASRCGVTVLSEKSHEARLTSKKLGIPQKLGLAYYRPPKQLSERAGGVTTTAKHVNFLAKRLAFLWFPPIFFALQAATCMSNKNCYLVASLELNGIRIGVA